MIKDLNQYQERTDKFLAGINHVRNAYEVLSGNKLEESNPDFKRGRAIVSGIIKEYLIPMFEDLNINTHGMQRLVSATIVSPNFFTLGLRHHDIFWKDKTYKKQYKAYVWFSKNELFINGIENTIMVRDILQRKYDEAVDGLTMIDKAMSDAGYKYNKELNKYEAI